MVVEGWKRTQGGFILRTVAFTYALIISLTWTMALIVNDQGFLVFGTILISLTFVAIALYYWAIRDETWYMTSKSFNLDLPFIADSITSLLGARGVAHDLGKVQDSRMMGFLTHRLEIRLRSWNISFVIEKVTETTVYIGPVTPYNGTEIDSLSRMVDEALSQGRVMEMMVDPIEDVIGTRHGLAHD